MASKKLMTLPQEKAAYRRTVTAVLVRFFEKSEDEAVRVVSDWWTRLAKTSAFKSGIFLHAEPLHTAIDLVNLDPSDYRLPEKDRDDYAALVRETMRPLDTASRKSSRVVLRQQLMDARNSIETRKVFATANS